MSFVFEPFTNNTFAAIKPVDCRLAQFLFASFSLMTSAARCCLDWTDFGSLSAFA